MCELSDRERLELFVWRANELEGLRLIRNDGLAYRMNLNWNHVRGMRFDIERPDEESLRSFLLTLRHFVMQKEPIFLNKIFNICFRHLSSAEMKSRIVEARESWKSHLKGNGVKVTFDESQMTPEYVANLVLNGYYFHTSDAGARRELERLGLMQLVMVDWIFLDHVIEVTRQVVYLAHVIRASLAEGYFSFDGSNS